MPSHPASRPTITIVTSDLSSDAADSGSPAAAGPTLVAQGRAGDTWRAIVITPIAGVVLGAAFGTVMVATRHGEFGFDALLAAVAAFTLCSLPFAAAVWIGWGLWYGCVRYVVEGPHILVYRGRRQVRKVDATTFDCIKVCGRVTWRDLVIPFGTFWTFWTMPPNVECWRQRPDQLGGKVKELPHVMLWGAEAAQRFHDDLAAALSHNDVVTPVTTDRIA